MIRELSETQAEIQRSKTHFNIHAPVYLTLQVMVVSLHDAPSHRKLTPILLKTTLDLNPNSKTFFQNAVSLRQIEYPSRWAPLGERGWCKEILYT